MLAVRMSRAAVLSLAVGEEGSTVLWDRRKREGLRNLLSPLFQWLLWRMGWQVKAEPERRC